MPDEQALKFSPNLKQRVIRGHTSHGWLMVFGPKTKSATQVIHTQIIIIADEGDDAALKYRAGMVSVPVMFFPQNGHYVNWRL